MINCWDNCYQQRGRHFSIVRSRSVAKLGLEHRYKGLPNPFIVPSFLQIFSSTMSSLVHNLSSLEYFWESILRTHRLLTEKSTMIDLSCLYCAWTPGWWHVVCVPTIIHVPHPLLPPHGEGPLLTRAVDHISHAVGLHMLGVFFSLAF